jgi:hypothetical protein
MAAADEVAGATGEFRGADTIETVARLRADMPMARPTSVAGGMRMHRNVTSRIGTAIAIAGLALSLSAGAVLAGEVTGNGKTLEPLHANSICAYSGLNDKTAGEGDLTSRTQSWGQDVRAAARAGIHGLGGVPGQACRGGSL